MLLCCVKKWFTNEQASFTMQKLKMIFFIYYNHFLLVFWKIKPCIITGIMQGLPFPIITYQVITGNYSILGTPDVMLHIITYQVITGNYSYNMFPLLSLLIITYQVITGNYSHTDVSTNLFSYYNIPSNNRELQHRQWQSVRENYYNIPSNNRELQLYC